MITLPWFPQGDPTSPAVESLLHRLAGDYYQTYDLFLSEEPVFSPQSTISLIQGDLGPKILFPNSSRIGVERFFPNPFPFDSNWIEKYFNWQLEWRQIAFEDRDPDPIEIVFDWPLKFTKDLKVSYLTFDYKYNDEIPKFTFDWYVRITETVKEGEDWIPIYPPVFNSMQFSEIVSIGSAEGLLSESNWILPSPSQSAQPRQQIQQITTTVTTEVQTTYSVKPTGVQGCGPTVISETNQISGAYSDPVQAGIDFNAVPLTPGGCVVNQVEPFNTLWTVESGVDNFKVFSGFGGSSPIATYLTAGEAQADGYLVPGQPETTVYFFYTRTLNYGPTIPCQFVSEDSKVTTIDDVQEDIVYRDPTIDTYFCIVAANNNYWALQIQIQDAGMLPKIFRADDATGLEFNLSLNSETVKVPIYSLEFDPSLASFSEKIQTTPFTFNSCFSTSSPLTQVQEKTSELQTQSNSTQSDTQVRTLVGFLSNQTFTELTNSALIDSYYFANNGSELDIDMPDSIRIKEIHTAINAGFFGNGQQKTLNTFGNIFNQPDDLQSLLTTYYDDPSLPLVVSNLVDFQSSQFNLFMALTGLYNYPLVRSPTYMDLDDSGSRRVEPDFIPDLVAHISKNDFETQAKLGLWPMETFNLAKVDDQGNAEPALYLTASDALGDLYALITRISVTSERASLSAYRADHHTVEIFKAIGPPTKREFVDWDSGITDLYIFSGALSLYSLAGEFLAEQSSKPTDFVPESIASEIEQATIKVSSTQPTFQSVVNDTRDQVQPPP